MAASAKGSKPKGDKKRVRKTQYKCPDCGHVSVFTTGQVMRCRSCGAYAVEEAADELPTTIDPGVAPVRAPPAAAQPPAEPPMALAIASLACGLAAAAAFFVFPVAILLALGAVGLGSAALARHGGDAGVQIMSVVGIVLGAVVLLFVFWLFWAFDGGSSWDGSGGETSGGGSGGGGGAERSGSSGGEGGGSAGGDGGTGTQVGVDSPAPAAMLLGVGLLAVARSRR
ncbi:MAG TPA: hypothetical protein VM327_05860 [Candidatus Thermoplasmatota archaeon]|nr:hypothetical protein [Candidatus Thermoplasmatota archaeon]